jgi:hypothetical protein
VRENIRVICVVDGELDFYLRRIIEYFEKISYGMIKFVQKRHNGLSDARNYGIKHCINTYSEIRSIIFLDSDDMFAPGSVNNMIKTRDEYKNRKVFVYPNIQNFGTRTEYWTPDQGRHKPYAHLYRNNLPYSVLVPVEAFIEDNIYYNKYYGVDEFSEDWNFSLNLVEKGWKPILSPKATLYYRNKEVSMATRIQNKLNIDFERNKKEFSKIYSLKNVEEFRIREISESAKDEDVKNLIQFQEDINGKIKNNISKYKTSYQNYMSINNKSSNNSKLKSILWSLLWVNKSIEVQLEENEIQININKKRYKIRIDKESINKRHLNNLEDSNIEKNNINKSVLNYENFNYFPKYIYWVQK